MSHTLDDKILNNLMFDNSSSMSLSRQYFIVLRMLQVFTEWIDDNMNLWEETRSLLIDDRHSFFWSGYESKARKQSLEDQLNIITQLLTSQTKQLKERVDRKTEEVKSLRDGVGSNLY